MVRMSFTMKKINDIEIALKTLVSEVVDEELKERLTDAQLCLGEAFGRASELDREMKQMEA